MRYDDNDSDNDGLYGFAFALGGAATYVFGEKALLHPDPVSVGLAVVSMGLCAYGFKKTIGKAIFEDSQRRY